MPPKKDSSPSKDSKKGSPKKNSPKKGQSPTKGKKGALDDGDNLPKDEQVQTEHTNMCLFCTRTFANPVNVQSHLFTMDHFVPEAPVYQRCRLCSLMIHIKDVESHQCSKNKAVFLDQIIATNAIFHGTPNLCIYCHGLRLSSKAKLVAHLLAVHGPDKQPGICGMCHFQHEETEPPPALYQEIQDPPPSDSVTSDDKSKKGSPRKDSPNKKEETPKKGSPKKDSPKKDSPKKGSPKGKKGSPSGRASALSDAGGEEKPVELGTDITGLPIDDTFAHHIRTEHDFGLEMSLKKAIWEDSQVRFPYACPFCAVVLKSNAAFHVHILGRHSAGQRYLEELLQCGYCHKPKWKPELLNEHIQYYHLKHTWRVGQRLVKYGVMTNFVDFSTTCTVCWTTFSYDFYLQNHIIVAHTHRNPYFCGWCEVDFRLVGDFKSTAKEMQKHEYEHARTIHARAIELKLTEDPLPPEEMPEDKEPEPETKRGGKKNSPKKASPKKDGSPSKASNKGSPDRSNKK